MRGTFSARQTFAVAAGVGLAVALAPMGVDAAKRTARAIAVDKKGRAKVVVANRPSITVRGEPTVRVPGGVAVTNRPTVEVGNQPTVTVANQPTVTVANQPTEMPVTAAPGKLTATTRPPLDAVFNVGHFDVDDLSPREIVGVSGSERAAVTHVLVGVRDFGSPVVAPTIADVVRYERVSGSSPCGQSGWAATVLRRITLRTDTSFALDLGAAPLVVRAQNDGEPRCLAVKLYQWVGDTRVDIGADGYRF